MATKTKNLIEWNVVEGRTEYLERSGDGRFEITETKGGAFRLWSTWKVDTIGIYDKKSDCKNHAEHIVRLEFESARHVFEYDDVEAFKILGKTFRILLSDVQSEGGIRGSDVFKVVQVVSWGDYRVNVKARPVNGDGHEFNYVFFGVNMPIETVRVGSIYRNKVSGTFWTVVGKSADNYKITLKSPKTEDPTVFAVVTLNAEFVRTQFNCTKPAAIGKGE